jgi:hypothetical protein
LVISNLFGCIVGLEFDEQDGVALVDFPHFDPDFLTHGSGDVFPHEVGFDGQFTMPSVYQYG